jgi:TetR/AcrR family transcriptional regulator
MSMTEVKARPRDAEVTRETLLEVATKLFVAQGYEGTSVQQIAEAAGVAKATPSYFFGSKEGIWKAVLDAQNKAAMEVAPKALARLQGGGSKEQLVEALVDSYLEFLEDHADFFRLIQWSELQHNPAINELPSHWEAIAKALEAVTAVLLKGKKKGEDPRQTVMSVIALCNAHLVYGNTLGLPLGVNVKDKKFLRERRAHLKRLLVAALL